MENNELINNLKTREDSYYKYDLYHTKLDKLTDENYRIKALIRALWQMTYVICYGLNIIIKELKQLNNKKEE